MDFISDALANGRRIKVLTIVDDFTKESVDLVAEHGISGQYVVRVLERAAQFRGLPLAIRTDQGPEFTSKALDQWAYQNGVQLKLIEAGKPTQNAYIESFNGRFRDECLNDHWFTSLAEARIRISSWRRDYNEHRPHSALNYHISAEFAANCNNLHQRRPTCIQRDFEPGITATTHPHKPGLTANEPAFIFTDLHLIFANQE